MGFEKGRGALGANNATPRPMKSDIKSNTDLKREFIEACYEGKADKVKNMLSKYPSKVIADEISYMRKQLSNVKEDDQMSISFTAHPYDGRKKSYDISSWNPILIAIGRGHINLVKVLFEHEKTVNSFHIINSLSKP